MAHGWQDYRLWLHGESFRVHWQELVASSMRQLALEDAPTLTKDEEKKLQQEKVRKAIAAHPGDRKRQIEATGLSERTFHRRLRELKLAVA